MNSKQNNPQGNQQSVSKEKQNPVADDSLQSTAPGAQPLRGSGNQQSDNMYGGSANVGQGSRQSGGMEPGERAGPGAQQGGWSSRQQGDRMAARGEESRQGVSQQSGYGGSEQSQHAGSQESPTGPAGNRQSENTRAQQKQGNVNAPASDSGSKRSKPGSSEV